MPETTTKPNDDGHPAAGGRDDRVSRNEKASVAKATSGRSGGRLGIPLALAEYRQRMDLGKPSPVDTACDAVATDPEAYRSAISPARLPVGRVSRDSRDSVGPEAVSAANTASEDTPEDKSPGGQAAAAVESTVQDDSLTHHPRPNAVDRARLNTALNHLKRARGTLSASTEDLGGSVELRDALAREVLADSVVERARVLSTFDDPADAFSRRPRSSGGGQSGAAESPWQAVPKLAGGGTPAAPFIFVAPDPATLWDATLTLTGQKAEAGDTGSDRGLDMPEPPDSSGDVIFCAGIGGTRGQDPKPNVGATELQNLLVSVIRGLEAPYRARQVKDGPAAIEPKPGEKFPNQRIWERARTDLKSAQDRFRVAQNHGRTLETALLGVRQATMAADEAQEHEQWSRRELHKRAAAEARARSDLASRDEELYRADSDREDHEGNKPGLLRRLVFSDVERSWLKQRKRLEKRRHSRLVAAEEAAGILEQAERDHEASRFRLSVAVRDERTARKNLDQARRRIEEWSDRFGPAAPDPQLYSEDEAERELALGRAIASKGVEPYLSEEMEEARAQLFTAALGIHRAFTLVNARPVAENLRVLLSRTQASQDNNPSPPLAVPQEPDSRTAQEPPRKHRNRRNQSRDKGSARGTLAHRPGDGLATG